MSTLDQIFGNSPAIPTTLNSGTKSSLDSIFKSTNPAGAPTQTNQNTSVTLDSIFKNTPPPSKQPLVSVSPKDAISNIFGTANDIVKKGGSNFADTIQPNADAMKKDITNDENNPLNQHTNIIKALSHGFGLAAHTVDTIFSPITSTLKAVADKMAETPTMQALAQTKGVGAVLDKVVGADNKYSDWAKANPHAADYLEGTVKSVMFGLGALDTEGLPSIKALGKSAYNDISGAAGDMINKGSELGDTAKQSIADLKGKVFGKGPNDVQSINEMITPKPTPTEAKLAETQGRLVKGKEPTLFKAGTGDQIIPTDQQVKTSFTIKRLIPDAGTMDEPTLYTEIGNKIGEIAKNLEPEMTKTPIPQETIQKITDDWEALKEKQLNEADKNDEPNVVKSQEQFEARLQSSGNKNMNDLWETAKEYDASVPDNVKRANNFSSDALQNKKQIWLQNRAILRSALTDSSTELGPEAQKAFSDMTDLYGGQTGILTKAKIDGPAMSKINQFLKDNPKIAAVMGGATVLDIMKHLGLPLPLP